MSDERRAFEVDDARVLEVLAHPLRGRLVAALRVDGPATASALAARVGESSGLASYHLRKLADVGVVEEDVDRGTRRERWWRASHELTRWSATRFLGNPEAHRASVAMRRNYYAWQARLLEQRLAEEAEWDAEWVAAANSSDDYLELTSAQASAMAEEIWSVVQRYRGESAPDDSDATRVIWLQHLVPVFGHLPL